MIRYHNLYMVGSSVKEKNVRNFTEHTNYVVELSWWYGVWMLWRGGREDPDIETRGCVSVTLYTAKK